MKNNLRNLLLSASLLIFVTAFFSCKQEFSPDDPLELVHAPSVFVGNNNKMVYSLDVETGAINWKISVEGEVHATPVLWGGAVWVGTDQGYLYKLDPRTGEVLGRVVYGGNAIEGTPMPLNEHLLVPAGKELHYVDINSLDDIWTYDAGSNIVASPAVHDISDGTASAVFISTTNGKVICLDNSGSDLWSYSPSNGGAFYSSPCVVNNNFLYIGNDNGYLYCLNTDDGSEKWAFKTNGMIHSSPINVGGNVMVGSNDRNFYSVDSASGKLRWKIETTDHVFSSPAVDNQFVYFAGFDGYIYCIDIIYGIEKWKVKTFGLIKASPTVYNNAVYVGSYDKNLYKLNVEDGSPYWIRNINAQMHSSVIIDTLGATAVVPSISGEYAY